MLTLLFLINRKDATEHRCDTQQGKQVRGDLSRRDPVQLFRPSHRDSVIASTERHVFKAVTLLFPVSEVEIGSAFLMNIVFGIISPQHNETVGDFEWERIKEHCIQ